VIISFTIRLSATFFPGNSALSVAPHPTMPITPDAQPTPQTSSAPAPSFILTYLSRHSKNLPHTAAATIQEYGSTTAISPSNICAFSVLQLSFDIHSRHQDHHHPAGVVLNPHRPLVYAPEIVASLTDEHQVPHLGGAYGAQNWAFGEYVQVFQLVVSVFGAV
jgi:hypothetical protein